MSNTQGETNADVRSMFEMATVPLMHYLVGLPTTFHGLGNIAQSVGLTRDRDGNINRNVELRIFHF
jgi:hypothetical protein